MADICSRLSASKLILTAGDQIADLRPGCAFTFGAICPDRDTGAAVAVPKANAQAMQLHLDDASVESIHDSVCVAWYRILGKPERIT